jgi:hypothetical protein
MTPTETYLRELRDIRSTGAGVKETSYYSALSNLFNEVGKRLKPRVRCIISLANRGAGLPDGGLFTAEQFQKTSDAEPLPGQLPARGVIEVKSTKDDAWITADGEQVSRYWGKYRQVLVTNYRDFVLVGQDADGKFAKLESFRLADSEKTFWAAAAHPGTLAKKIEARFAEYLLRVMRHAAQLAAPEDVAWFLASYARDGRARLEGVELAALETVRTALEEALGLKFEGEKGEHFFRSSLVQTLFYGVFSAWVLWAKQNAPTSKARFDWYTTARYLRVPMISKLFHLVADPQELEALKLTEVLDWTTLVLNRVDRRSFFDKFQESRAVQYFYEPFLEAFDPDLRKELGVWYTPPEIVKYMVERVDKVLREELSLPDGLANKNVYVLDPCCGTGSYLVEVLDRIHRTLKERGEDALTASDLKDAAQNRVFGFEILPAPFVVSHLQLGLLLQKLGAPLSDKSKERVGVYLTNALTGWEPPKGPKAKLLFSELEEERDAAEHVKREVPILVILGNPPYNAFAGVSPEEEHGLVEPYKEGLSTEWGIKKYNLDDFYVRFFRLAERRIAEKGARGVVSFISNFSYLSDPSFVVMRQRFLHEFNALWFDCMNGDSRETGKLTPAGEPDPSVFSTPSNREGIKLGTSIALLVRCRSIDGDGVVRLRHFWGIDKRANLLNSLASDDIESDYQNAQPERNNRFSFRPSNLTPNYLGWPRLVDFCDQSPISGILEMRRGALMDFSRDALAARMRTYLDPNVSWDQLKILNCGPTIDGGRFNARMCRERIRKVEGYADQRVIRYQLYPFDVRWCYYSSVRPLWNEPRPALTAQAWDGNKFIVTRMNAERPHEHLAIIPTSVLPDYHLLRPNAVAIPIWIRPLSDKRNVKAQSRLFGNPSSSRANLGAGARVYLSELGFDDPDKNMADAELVWMHSFAIGCSQAYLSENGDGIRQDWPRIPLPGSKEALLASAALGRQIAALLDTETEVGAVREPPLPAIAAFVLQSGMTLNEAEHFAVIAGWGHAGQGGVTMPGKGKMIDRDYTEKERASLGEAVKLLGQRTCDVYLNEFAYWSNIPIRVWEYTIGGYQVMKKWLSYREEKLLGRPLTKDEVRYVQEMARRIAAIILLEPALDENYRKVKAHTYEWASSS